MSDVLNTIATTSTSSFAAPLTAQSLREALIEAKRVLNQPVSAEPPRIFYSDWAVDYYLTNGGVPPNAIVSPASARKISAANLAKATTA